MAAACIDSGGHYTQEAYKFARARVGRNIWAIKGASDASGQWSPVWPSASQDHKARKFRLGWRPVVIGVNSAKEAVRQRLLVDEVGPGYCHFPSDREEEYFDQLTSEELRIERRHGSVLRKWYKKKNAANEALDCRVYAYAALQGLYIVRRLDLAKQQLALDAYVPPSKDNPAPVVKRRASSNSWVDGT